MESSDFGVAVSDRLSAVPGIVRSPALKLELFILRDFLDAETRSALVELIDRDRKPSRLLSDNPDPKFRTSETCNLDPDNATVQSVETRINALLGIPAVHGERLQGQRYDVGQEFKPHHDYLRKNEAYWEKQQAIGGQRTWTAMAFLNAPEAGGETYFPLADLRILPRPGSLVTWNNLDADGEPNRLTLHQGMPVRAGVKYIITKWYRERPWGVARATDA